jgi:hypothetical protein
MDDAWEQARPKATGLECTDLSFIGLPFQSCTPWLSCNLVLQHHPVGRVAPAMASGKRKWTNFYVCTLRDPLRRTNS